MPKLTDNSPTPRIASGPRRPGFTRPLNLSRALLMDSDRCSTPLTAQTGLVPTMNRQLGPVSVVSQPAPGGARLSRTLHHLVGPASARPVLAPLMLAIFLLLGGDPLQAQSARMPEAAGQRSLAVPGSGALSLEALVRQVRESNRLILGKQAERDIALAGIDRARAVFQPTTGLAVTNGQQRQANTYEETLIRNRQGIYERDGTDYSVTLSKLFETGTKVEGKVTMSKFITNIKQQQPDGGGDDYKAFYGLTLTHPLARDAGRDVTLARVRVAEIEAAGARLSSLDTESTVVAEAILAYWDLVLAQERLKSSEEKVGMGRRLLVEARALNRQGRVPESDVWDVENNLTRFLAGVSEARQGVVERANKIRTLLMALAVDAPSQLSAIDPMPAVNAKPRSLGEAIKIARERRSDYLQRQSVIQREDQQLSYARNQQLPRVDLVASYGLNGLGQNESRAFSWNLMQDYPTWTFGVQAAMPLGENRQAKADVVAAQIRRDDALTQLRGLEVAISNDLDTSIRSMEGAAERWALWSDLALREARQLQAERARFNAGRSDMREILQREERVINARLGVTEQQVAWARADALVEAAQGTLLDRFK
jgi:outer membrane protein TolC